MVHRPGRAQERPDAGEAVGADKTQPGVEGLGLGRVGHEIDHVRQRARPRRHVGPQTQRIRLALRLGTGCIDAFARQQQRPPHADLEGEREAHVVGAAHDTVAARHLAVALQFGLDGVERVGIGHAVDGLAQQAGGAQAGALGQRLQ